MITSAHLLTYAKKKGITIREAKIVFDRVYQPTINGWRLREAEGDSKAVSK